MNWIQSLSKTIDYIENHLRDDINIDKISRQAYTTSSHFQLVFHLIMGMTIGEYIRSRRLSLAAQDLLQSNERIIDVALRYQYDTPESFSKAFTRFHGVPPSKACRGNIKRFDPLSIRFSVQGGFNTPHKLVDEFYWRDHHGVMGEELPDAEKYRRIINWAAEARGHNPNVFDALTEWILDDSEWGAEKLAENQQILMQGVLARFKEQNVQLRSCLSELEPGVVNAAVFSALNRFDRELSGAVEDKGLREAVGRMFSDFSSMGQRSVRQQIAGNKTGPTGTDYVELFGYINCLKDCDAAVQWALFMPEAVEKQQNGFKVQHFEYKTMPAMRFIGCEGVESRDIREQVFSVLDAMGDYKSGFDYDIFFMHHYGKNVDVGPWHGFWGRFMKAGAPAPTGFISFDFVPERAGGAGLPYISQFAFATFSGDPSAMHRREGFDSDAMYDVTRNIMLGQGVTIPYPDKYWTAEVFLDGFEKDGTAYLFSAEL